MTVKVSKPAINVREELADLRKPTGIAGEAMLRAETPQEQFQLIGAGRRNLIINGDMRIAQRGTSASSPADGGYTNVDRFQVYRNGAGVLQTGQSGVAPDGFKNSLLVECATADTSIAGADFGGISYYVEAQDLLGTALGTASAKPLTLSFWVRANLTGLYSVAVRQPNSTVDSYVDTYYINAVDTWEYKTITIAPDTGVGNWTMTGNGRGLQVAFALWNGGSYGGAEYGKWLPDTNDVGSSENVNFVSSTSNVFRITGVQLELGKVATPFEHRSYGEELAACQRYFCRPISNVDEDGNSNVHNAIGVGRGAGNGAVVVWSLLTPVPLRDRPEITSSGSYYLTDATSRTSATPTLVVINQFTVNGSNLLAHYTFSSSVCDDDRVVMVGGHTAVKIDLDAEL